MNVPGVIHLWFVVSEHLRKTEKTRLKKPWEELDFALFESRPFIRIASQCVQ